MGCQTVLRSLYGLVVAIGYPVRSPHSPVNGINVLVSMLTPGESRELELDGDRSECEAHSLRFINIPVEDRAVPADRDGFCTSRAGLRYW
jgi:hypothetical protein